MTDLERDAELMAMAVRYDQSRQWCRAAVGLSLGSAVILSAVWIRQQWFGVVGAQPKKPPTAQLQVQQFAPEAASAPMQASSGI